MRFPIISRCIQTKVEDNYRIKITFHHSFQRLKGSVKRLKRFCKFEEYKSRKSYKSSRRKTK